MEMNRFYSSRDFQVNFNQKIDSYIPSRDGFVFEGWYFDKALKVPFDLDTMPARDVTLYGNWIPRD
jgi:uncharacterized repeat protein (TIGR02543 family)